jgi:DNA-binding LytR/AlgR family response regulator
MVTAVIADDEQMLRDALKDHLNLIWPELNIVGEAKNGKDALALIQDLQPDIAFLDISMPDVTGMEVAKSITTATRIVFVTSYENFALQAFEANAVDYIVKPIDIPRLSKVVVKLKKQFLLGQTLTLEQLKSALDKWTNTSNEQREKSADKWLKVSVGNNVKITEVKDVCFFESDSKYTRVVTCDFQGLIRTTIKDLAAEYEDGFLMAHRGVLVNKRFIKTIIRREEQMEIELRSDMGRLKVSAANQHLFRSM